VRTRRKLHPNCPFDRREPRENRRDDRTERSGIRFRRFLVGVADEMEPLGRVIGPVADESDAVATATAVTPHLEEIQHVTVVHGIENGSGAVEKAQMEKRRVDAMRYLSTVESRLEGGATVETRVAFGPDVAETVLETAVDTAARAIVFRRHGSSRLVRYRSDETAIRLVTATEVPVVAVTAESPAQALPKGRPRGDDTEVA
jgi:nucleotide-binding universal stress UspA family protein